MRRLYPKKVLLIPSFIFLWIICENLTKPDSLEDILEQNKYLTVLTSTMELMKAFFKQFFHEAPMRYEHPNE